jgi:hypothetical protein
MAPAEEARLRVAVQRILSGDSYPQIPVGRKDVFSEAPNFVQHALSDEHGRWRGNRVIPNHLA